MTNRIIGINGNQQEPEGLKIQVGVAQEKGLVILKVGEHTLGFTVMQALLVARDVNANALAMLFGPVAGSHLPDEGDDNNDSGLII